MSEPTIPITVKSSLLLAVDLSRLDEGQRKELQTECFRRGCGMSELIAQFIDEMSRRVGGGTQKGQEQ